VEKLKVENAWFIKHVKNINCVKSLGHFTNTVCGGMMVCSLPQFQNKWLSPPSG